MPTTRSRSSSLPPDDTVTEGTHSSVVDAALPATQGRPLRQKSRLGSQRTSSAVVHQGPRASPSVDKARALNGNEVPAPSALCTSTQHDDDQGETIVAPQDEDEDTANAAAAEEAGDCVTAVALEDESTDNEQDVPLAKRYKASVEPARGRPAAKKDAKVAQRRQRKPVATKVPAKAKPRDKTPVEEEDDSEPSLAAEAQDEVWEEDLTSLPSRDIPPLDPPPELLMALLPYQRQFLGWAVAQERSAVRGGILADEMGLGKTIQGISLIVTHRSDDMARLELPTERTPATQSAPAPSRPKLRLRTVSAPEPSRDAGGTSLPAAAAGQTEGAASAPAELPAADVLPGNMQPEPVAGRTDDIAPATAVPQVKEVTLDGACQGEANAGTEAELDEGCAGKSKGKPRKKPSRKAPPPTADPMAHKDVGTAAAAIRSTANDGCCDGQGPATATATVAWGKATLVICPLVAVIQWRGEIARYTLPGSVKVVIYHGNKRATDVAALQSADVVLTTYSVLENEFRRFMQPGKAVCEYCGKKFLPDRLRVHLRFFCGPNALKSAALAKQQKKRGRPGSTLGSSMLGRKPSTGSNADTSTRVAIETVGSTGTDAGTKRKHGFKKAEPTALTKDGAGPDTLCKGDTAGDDVAGTAGLCQASKEAPLSERCDGVAHGSNSLGRGGERLAGKAGGRGLTRAASSRSIASKSSKRSARGSAGCPQSKRSSGKKGKVTSSKAGSSGESEWEASSASDSVTGSASEEEDADEDAEEDVDMDDNQDSNGMDAAARDAQRMIQKAAKQSSKDDEQDAQVSLLHKVLWRRIILDEAHCIKDRRCSTAKAVFALKSKYKWALSGTPLQNRVGELYSLIRFLQIHPYSYYFCRKCECESLDYRFTKNHRKCDECDHGPLSHYCWWNRWVANPIKNHGYQGKGRNAMELLRNVILERILIRRTKVQCADVLALPPRTVVLRKDRFDEREADFYEALYTQSQAQFDAYVQTSTVLNNYAHIFDLLIRLRQAVNHPYLVVHSSTAPPTQAALPEAGVKEEQGACALCHDPVEDPVISACHHTFCRSCVVEFLNSATGQCKCPVCNRALSVNLSLDAPGPSPSKALTAKQRRSILHRIDIGKFQSSSKIEALREELYAMKQRDPAAKAVIFSQFINFLDLVYFRLTQCGIKCVRLSGNMSMAQRDVMIDQFTNDPDVPVFLLSLKAGGVALNLTAASNVMLMDPWWNPATEQQAMDRIHRIGQYKPIHVTRFVIGGTIEERIIKLQEKKQLVFEATVGKDTEALGKLTEEDLKFLFA